MKWQYQLTLVALLSIWSCDSFRAFYPICKGYTKETWAKVTECCDMFAFINSYQMRTACIMECLQGEDTQCCYDMCYANVTGIYANDTFNPAILERSLTNNSTDPATVALVKQVMTECAAIYPIDKALFCDVPEFIFLRARCCLMKGFSKGPKALANKDCQALLPTFASCAIK